MNAETLFVFTCKEYCDRAAFEQIRAIMCTQPSRCDNGNNGNCISDLLLDVLCDVAAQKHFDFASRRNDFYGFIDLCAQFGGFETCAEIVYGRPTVLGTLYRAARNGHCAIVKFLLEESVDPAVLSPMRPHASLLHFATHGRAAAMVSMLLRQCTGIIDLADEDGHTALHIAILSQQPVIVDLLLYHGADAGVKAVNNSTALEIAAILDKVDLVESLLATDTVTAPALFVNNALLSDRMRNLLVAHSANSSLADHLNKMKLTM